MDLIITNFKFDIKKFIRQGDFAFEPKSPFNDKKSLMAKVESTWVFFQLHELSV